MTAIILYLQKLLSLIACIELILIEGKYHQVKRMLLAVGNEVVYLQRTAIGPRTIDGLVSGTYKELSPHECVETLGITLS